MRQPDQYTAEYNTENRDQLAQDYITGLDRDDLVSFAVGRLVSDYEGSERLFHDDWYLIYEE